MPCGNSARQLLFNGGDIACGAVVRLLQRSLAYVRGSGEVNMVAHMVEGQQAVEEHESSIGNLQVRFGERGDELGKSDLEIPDAAFMFFDRLLAFDHVRHQIHIIAAADVRKGSLKQAYDRAARDIAAIEKKLAGGIPARHRKKAKKSKAPSAKQTSRTILTREEYMNNIVKAKEYIAAGDIF